MNPIKILSVSTLAFLIAGELIAQQTVSPHKIVGEIERLDPALDKLIDVDAPIELLATGFEWSEGPVWIEGKNGEDGFVVFSDVPENVIYKWKEGEGLSEYLRPSGYTGSVARGGESGSNGLALDAEGRLLICQHGDQQVGRMISSVHEPSPKYATITGNYNGKKYNSPNDLAVHSSGAIYFTDPPYGNLNKFDHDKREIGFLGVYRVDLAGKVTLLTKLKAPNGIAFSPDEKTMYVAQSWPEERIWMAYNVKADGTIDKGRQLFDSTGFDKDRLGNPDGLKIDQNGNLFATGPGGVLILTPKGKHLGTIRPGEKVANVAFGNDGKTLYMTCDMHLCRVRLKTTGLSF